MALYLEVIQGELHGERFPAREGFRLGRITGEILIPDKKISSLHAQIELQNNQLILIDRGSSNGLLVGQQRVPNVVLLPGVKFTAGKTTFQVIEHLEPIEQTQQGDLPSEVTTPSHQGWKDALTQNIPTLAMQNNESFVNIQAFDPALELSFISGPELGRKIVLGFGPRKFGADVLDIELLDKYSPLLAFELIPEGQQILIRTTEANTVFLNNKRFSTEYLKGGDKIQIASTEILVSRLQHKYDSSNNEMA